MQGTEIHRHARALDTSDRRGVRRMRGGATGGVVVPGVRNAAFASVAPAEEWQRLDVDVTVTVHGAPGERFGQSRSRTLAWRLTRELQADSTWTTSISTPAASRGLTASEVGQVPVRSERSSNGARRLVNAVGGQVSAQAPTVDSWLASDGRPSRFAASRSGPPRNLQGLPASRDNSEAIVMRASGAAKALARLDALPGVSKMMRGAGRATYAVRWNGMDVEIDADTTFGRVHEVRSRQGAVTTTTKHSYVQADPETSVLTRSEHVKRDAKGQQVGALVTVTDSNVQTLRVSSTGS